MNSPDATRRRCQNRLRGYLSRYKSDPRRHQSDPDSAPDGSTPSRRPQPGRVPPPSPSMGGPTKKTKKPIHPPFDSARGIPRAGPGPRPPQGSSPTRTPEDAREGRDRGSPASEGRTPPRLDAPAPSEGPPKITRPARTKPARGGVFRALNLQFLDFRDAKDISDFKIEDGRGETG